MTYSHGNASFANTVKFKKPYNFALIALNWRTRNFGYAEFAKNKIQVIKYHVLIVKPYGKEELHFFAIYAIKQSNTVAVLTIIK